MATSFLPVMESPFCFVNFLPLENLVAFRACWGKQKNPKQMTVKVSNLFLTAHCFKFTAVFFFFLLSE